MLYPLRAGLVIKPVLSKEFIVLCLWLENCVHVCIAVCLCV